MTQAMRERLIEVAERTAYCGVFNDDPVSNWPEVVDAILLELREHGDGVGEQVDDPIQP